MALEKIEAYKTSDGKVHTSEHEAKKHEEKILIKEKIDEIVEEGCYRGMDKDDISNFIIENGAEIFTALSTRIH